jgi:hypothetical protein
MGALIFQLALQRRLEAACAKSLTEIVAVRARLDEVGDRYAATLPDHDETSGGDKLSRLYYLELLTCEREALLRDLAAEQARVGSLYAELQELLTTIAKERSLRSDSKPRAGRKVRPAPGHHLLAMAELLFSRAAVESVLEPTVEDMRAEYNDALLAARPRKAILVRVRGTWAFLKAAGLLKALGFVKSVTRMWSAI